MQSHSNLETTLSCLSAADQSVVPYFDGEYIAKLFSFYRRQLNPYKSKNCPLALVSGKSLYNRHKQSFDAFAKAANYAHLDVEPYIKYCVNCGITENCLSACIKSTTMLNKYKLHVMQIHKLENIYNWFKQSALNIAKICISNGLFSSKDFFKLAISRKLIGKLVFTGEVSLHYFAAIPNFKQIICKLDHFSQDELRPLNDHFDIYHSEINMAFLHKKNTYINPIDFTDKVIAKLHAKKKKKPKVIN